MRIPITLAPWGNSIFGFVPISFEISNLNINGSILFMVDTGASKTTISWVDASRNGIQYNSFPLSRNAVVGIGTGARVYLMNHDIKFYFIGTTGAFSVIKHGIAILENPARTPIPSLLGNDFLDAFGFRLIYDRPTQSAYLDQ